ncbi:hydroxysteroid dehydrogenase-like protein 1 isoform X2 [Hydra vulgaris]|uniref:Hydroxysteroid dehydrogenase-like protein 1 isoform X2 n=1 Tax=Hydra vulgaris TaxID=6087 RepID=A0ABM4DFD9_HYDVU
MSLGLDGYLIVRSFDEFICIFDNIRNGLAIVGAIYTTSAVIKLLKRIIYITRVYAIPKLLYSSDLSLKYGGKWAVVTGASEGIGRSYARKLAQRKLNVLLICKNTDKLLLVAEEISLDYNVQTKCISMELVNLSEDSFYSFVENTLNEIDVGILVNNVGTNDINLFACHGRKPHQQLIDINIKSIVLLTHMVLPQMIKRKAGAIVNIFSLMSNLPFPYLTLYFASKAFIDSFSKLLQIENACHNIYIQSLQPGFKCSLPLQNSRLSRFFVVDPDTYCESAINTLGTTHSTHGYWKYGAMEYLNEFFDVF